MQLNIYYFIEDNHHCGSCDEDSDHVYWALITPLDQADIKKEMQDCAKLNERQFHKGHFLEALYEHGIFMHSNGHPPDFEIWTGSLMGEILDLGEIREEDIFSLETFRKLVEDRRKEILDKAERRKEAERARIEAQERY